MYVFQYILLSIFKESGVTRGNTKSTLSSINPHQPTEHYLVVLNPCLPQLTSTRNHVVPGGCFPTGETANDPCLMRWGSGACMVGRTDRQVCRQLDADKGRQLSPAPLDAGQLLAVDQYRPVKFSLDGDTTAGQPFTQA